MCHALSADFLLYGDDVSRKLRSICFRLQKKKLEFYQKDEFVLDGQHCIFLSRRIQASS